MEVKREANKKYYETHKEELKEKARSKKQESEKDIRKTPQELGIPKFLEPYIKINKCSWSMAILPDLESLAKLCTVIHENYEEIEKLKSSNIESKEESK